MPLCCGGGILLLMGGLDTRCWLEKRFMPLVLAEL